MDSKSMNYLLCLRLAPAESSIGNVPYTTT